jgi:hypothetical protein
VLGVRGKCSGLSLRKNDGGAIRVPLRADKAGNDSLVGVTYPGSEGFALAQ